MRKILIADDEYLVRKGLSETVDWASIDAQIVGEASDGAEALSLAQSLKPDLIITDVRMPLMDGINFAKNLKATGFDGKIIVLSAYRDFDYAKQSFENGVFAYVLKPIENSDILAEAAAALANLEAERKKAELYNGLRENMPLLSEKAIAAIIKGEIKDENDLKERLALFGLPRIDEGYLILARIDQPALNEKASLSALRKSLLAFLSDGPTWLTEMDGMLAAAFGTKDSTPLKTDLEAALRDFESQSADVVSVAYSHFGHIGEIGLAYGIALKSIGNKLMVGLSAITDADHVPLYSKNVIAAMDFISRHYMDDLTIKKAADALLVSESYLMHLFKDNLGQTFNEILTSYRMTVAKNLLAGGRYRVKEVANLVGYRDVKYFSSVFAKTVGETPSNYGRGDGSAR